MDTDFEEEIPDSTTVCRFRNLLISGGLLEKALKNINRQFEEKNLKVKPTAEANHLDTGKRSSTGWFPRSYSRSNKLLGP
ncbi:MAG: hypothetical protein LBD81_03200 [Holosporaceae bacterium]|nr:hypothetical protein [Holosporaceae bacterium]